MKILLTGAAGQLGNELYPLLADMGRVTAVDLGAANSNAPGCLELDLGDAGQLESLLNRSEPDLIVNAAAYTAVDRAEEDTELAFRINGEMPGRVARWAAHNGKLMVHYSTDYVFDGTSREPYTESDQPAPQNIYGESKLAGERAIASSGCRGMILRTSWVYSAHGSNFVLSMLKLARRNLHLRIVDDQVGCPTWARNLARATQQLLQATLQGDPKTGHQFYHYCDNDAVSWFDFAALVFTTATGLGLLEQVPELTRVTSSEYPQVAKRPAYSVLDTTRIRQEAGVVPAPLQDSLLNCMQELVSDER